MKRYSILLLILFCCITACKQHDYQSGQYYKIEYRPSTEKDGLQLGVTYTLWIPAGVKTVRGIIVHQHGASIPAAKAGLTAAYDLHWQALARKWECALMGPSYHVENDDVGDIPGGAQLWFDARRGSERTFLQSLEDFSVMSGHPEISEVPWCLWGHSGGGIWSHTMASLHPDRVIAMWLRSGVANMFYTRPNFPKLQTTEAIYSIPVMCNPGLQEQGILNAQIEMFKDFRAHGAPIGVAPDPLTGHWCGDSRYLAIPFLDACLEMRLPEKGGKLKTLRPVDMKKSWLAPLLSDKAVEAALYEGDITESVWLPNKIIAEKWMEYIKTGLVSDHTPPPAPFNVKVVGNKVSWDAEADFESGISHFIIMRDGNYYARVPEKPVQGFHVRSLFQSGYANSYHDTPADPVPEMSFVDSMATGKHKYTVISVNSAGLQSLNTVEKQPQISIVTDTAMGQVAQYGMNKFTETLQAMNIPFENVNSLADAKGKNLLVVGLSEGNGITATLLKKGNRIVPSASEALTIWKTRWQKKPVTLVAGYDDKGIMYALLDIAKRISWSDKRTPMKYVKEVISKPYVEERGIAMYTMHRRYWESRFHSEKFWIDYFDMMACNRLNMLEILFGYENGGFMAPCYPYFFDVEGFPEVKMGDITPEQQKRNIDAMHRMIAIAHERGIGVRLGVWDHIYRGGVQAGGNREFEYSPDKSLPWQVTGIETTGNLIPYTKAAFAKLLTTFPELDAILFKTNNESGLKTEELHDFSVSFFETVAETAPNMHIDIHSKGLTDTLINTVINLGIKFRIAPKFWMEQLGLPFSPTHVNREDQKNRRHGYANMLRYPQKYQMLWKLWNGGTNRAFLWGDPEYVRRFANSSRLYNSSAYAVYEPMATKMETQFHDVEPFDLLKPQYRYYNQEYERYWYFFQVWGLVGYDPNTSTEVWDKEFEKRFGVKVAPIVQSALNEASWILPRIIAACYPYSFFPTTSAWPEKQRLGDLPLYARAEGSDIQQFASFDQEAQVLLGLYETGKTLPSTTSLWLQKLSESIDRKVIEAEKKIKTNDNKEFNSTIVDLKMLSRLALYHSRRVPAAISYCLFLRTQDVTALDAAITHEQNAIQAWKELVEAAGDVYADNILIGRVPLSGHWRDELVFLERGLERLKEQKTNFKPNGTVTQAPAYKTATTVDNERFFRISHTPVESSLSGQPVTVRIKVTAPAGIKWVHLQYRAVNQYLDFTMLPMTLTDEKNTFEATIPADKINTTYDLMYLIEVMDNNGKGFIYPNLNKETPYQIVSFRR